MCFFTYQSNRTPVVKMYYVACHDTPFEIYGGDVVYSYKLFNVLEEIEKVCVTEEM